MALVQVLLADDHATGTPPIAAALARLVAHPVISALHAERAVHRLVTRASAVVQVREDTHFKLSRAMPPVRHAVLEAGRRLAAAGLIDALDDVWFLTWPQLQVLPDPAATPSGGAALRASVERRKAAWQRLAGSR